MKLILKENIAGLGYKDDVVEVKDGYGRNYLIPQGKAIVASKAALKQLAEDRKQRVHKIAKIKADAEAAAQALEGIKLTIAAKTSATGTIFGSVNSIQIAEALLKLGHEVDRKDHRNISAREGSGRIQCHCALPQGSFRRGSF